MSSNAWQAAVARHRFSEVVDAAVAGRPQFVRRRDGKEVVIVSREYFERTRPDLKSVLLSFQFGEPGDAFDQALDEARGLIGAAFMPVSPPEKAADADDPGHERRQWTPPASS
jgi:hypothetical protein